MAGVQHVMTEDRPLPGQAVRTLSDCFVSKSLYICQCCAELP